MTLLGLADNLASVEQPGRRRHRFNLPFKRFLPTPIQSLLLSNQQILVSWAPPAPPYEGAGAIIGKVARRGADAGGDSFTFLSHCSKRAVAAIEVESQWRSNVGVLVLCISGHLSMSIASCQVSVAAEWINIDQNDRTTTSVH